MIKKKVKTKYIKYKIIKLFKTEYGNLDSTRSKSANDKYIDYFNKVINDVKVAPKYKAIANYCLGLTYELNSEENEARKCYEYVLKHSKMSHFMQLIK